MFKSVVSLGFFCGVAQEIERLGLRSKSMPFDWVITTSFPCVLNIIESRFSNYVGTPHYVEMDSNRADNDEYQIQFFHDFKRPASIENQLQSVVEKYERRSNYFLNAIKQPTLFIRYIINQEEYEWIKNNKDRIDSVLNTSNAENEIVFIGHCEFDGELGYQYFKVEPDEHDVVARKFSISNKKVYDYLTSKELFDPSQRKKNLRFYRKSKTKKWLRKFIDKGNALLKRS